MTLSPPAAPCNTTTLPLIDDEERAVEEMFRVHAEIDHRLDDCCLPLLDRFTNGELDVDQLHAAMMHFYCH